MKHQSDAVTTNRSVRARAIGHPHRTNRTLNMGIGAFLKGAVKGVKGAVKKILPKKDDSKGSAADAKAPLMNSAFVFIKPHANTRAVQDLVVAKLTSKRVKILAEGDIAAAKIDPKGAELYRYLNFDQIEGFEDSGRVVSSDDEAKVLAGV